VRIVNHHASNILPALRVFLFTDTPPPPPPPARPRSGGSPKRPATPRIRFAGERCSSPPFRPALRENFPASPRTLSARIVSEGAGLGAVVRSAREGRRNGRPVWMVMVSGGTGKWCCRVGWQAVDLGGESARHAARVDEQDRRASSETVPALGRGAPVLVLDPGSAALGFCRVGRVKTEFPGWCADGAEAEDEGGKRLIGPRLADAARISDYCGLGAGVSGRTW